MCLKRPKKTWGLVAAKQFYLFFKLPYRTEAIIYNDKVTEWDLKLLF